MELVSQFIYIFLKDLKSEVRTRYSLSAFILFIVTTVTIIVFSTAGETLSSGISSGILWVILFFGAMTGLAKGFVSEEERGTSLLLKLSATPTSVYFGKLLYNILMSLVLNTFATLLFVIFNTSLTIKMPFEFVLSIFWGSIGIAAASTIISAIIARANTRGALFPVLSFPVLLPLIVVGVDVTKITLEGSNLSGGIGNFPLMIAYCGIIIPVSFILFEHVWRD